MTPTGGTSVQASQSIASSAKSGIDSQGSSYGLSSGTGDFIVGGGSGQNNQLLILGGIALVAIWMMFKR